MRNVFIGIAFALALVIVRIGVHQYYVHKAMDDEMDAYVDAKLTQPLAIPLDCPPLGQEQVTFLTDESSPGVTAQNAPLIQKHWGEIWPAVYQGIQNETNDWKDEEKHMLSQKVEIKVDLPAKLMEENTSWQIEYDCAAGYFTTEMNGYTVGQTQIGN